MMEEYLQPCPFCGGKAKIVGGTENWKPTYYDPDSGGDPIAVLCESCECGLHYFEDYGQAIKAWNKRVEYKIRTDEDIQTLNEAIHTINSLRKINKELRTKLYSKQEISDEEVIADLIKSKQKYNLKLGQSIPCSAYDEHTGMCKNNNKLCDACYDSDYT